MGVMKLGKERRERGKGRRMGRVRRGEMMEGEEKTEKREER